DRACTASGADELTEALSPVMHAVLGGLGALFGTRLELADLYEVGVGEPLAVPGAETFTAGLFADDEQVGNVIFFVTPDAMAPPDLAVASFPDAPGDLGTTNEAANPLSLLRGVEMRVTAELGRT